MFMIFKIRSQKFYEELRVIAFPIYLLEETRFLWGKFVVESQEAKCQFEALKYVIRRTFERIVPQEAFSSLYCLNEFSKS